MKAFHIPKQGELAEIMNIPTPTPKKGEIRVKIHACGLNFADLLMQKGTYQDTPEAPFTLGMEISGTIDAIGPDTEAPDIGRRVAVFGGQGGLAEYGCFDVNRCVVIPESMSFKDAAAFQIAYGTSHVALDYKAGLKPGETLVVLGAAGGVGLTAVEIGKVIGAKVIAVARGADKLKVAQEAGADHVIDAESDDLRGQIKAMGGADVVYDPVGGEQFKDAFRACNPEARIIVIGFASGEVPKIAANHLLVKNITVQGFYWGGYSAFKPSVVTDSLATLLDWYTAGKIKPHISHSFDLDSAGEAFDTLRARKSTGKVVVQISHD